MIKKVVLLTVLLVAFGLGTAFADQIDSLASSSGPAAPTQVYVNPGGLGDVLIYGYYNVRGNDSIFAVTNTDTQNGARVRIRFKEAATLGAPYCNGSFEVLDFDICLSPGDVWSGVITSTANGALLISDDTDTYIQASPPPAPAVIFPTAYPNGVLFKSGAANNGITADQTLEGYFEIIAERQLQEVLDDGTCGPDLYDMIGYDVDNVLMGHHYIVNLPSSRTFGYAATALGNFTFSDITSPITTNRPNLQLDSETGTITPVNYALTKNAVYSVYDLESNIQGDTALIVTFPTKFYTHDEVVIADVCVTDADDIFDDPRVKVIIFDDKENSPQTVCEFSPCEPGVDVELPHEVNVINISGSNIFASDVETAVATNFDFGWISVDMVDTNTTAPVPAHQTTFGYWTSWGLPAIGYVVHSFGAGDFSGMLPVQYTTNIWVD
jgi:hypothetical protein